MGQYSGRVEGVAERATEVMMDENRYAGTPWKAVSRRTILASPVYSRPPAGLPQFQAPWWPEGNVGLSNESQGEGTDG